MRLAILFVGQGFEIFHPISTVLVLEERKKSRRVQKERPTIHADDLLGAAGRVRLLQGGEPLCKARQARGNEAAAEERFLAARAGFLGLWVLSFQAEVGSCPARTPSSTAPPSRR
jgi:hypothetical protein